VLLIASYGLMIHGGGAERLRAGVQYVVYNLAGSTLFLFALGTIYGVTGTLNMADLALRVAELPPEDTALVRVAAVLLLAVFAIKAALVPLHFWLPGTYAAAPAPVAALFAILTKVGAYAILRVYTMIWGPEAASTAGLIGDLLIPAALVTLAVGSLGTLGARDLGRLAAHAGVASMGTLLLAIGMFTPASTVAALYYLVHSTFAAAALFLVVDLVSERRRSGTALSAAPPIAQSGMIAALFFAAAIGMAGMPPLSGFLGKLLVMDAARPSGQMGLVWATILVTSLIAVVGFARAGSALFWKAHEGGAAAEGAAPPGSALPLAATMSLLGALVLVAVLAGPLTSFLQDTAAQLYAPAGYIDAVLGPRDGG
jgi:multicomponent K+:H+ antiporter subunit D